MDLDVCIRSSDCQYTVQFFGALFYEVRSLKDWSHKYQLASNTQNFFFLTLCPYLAYLLVFYFGVIAYFLVK